jgi:hypothetical protein
MEQGKCKVFHIHTRKVIQGEERYSSTHLTLALDGGKTFISHTGLFTPLGKNPNIH